MRKKIKILICALLFCGALGVACVDYNATMKASSMVAEISKQEKISKSDKKLIKKFNKLQSDRKYTIVFMLGVFVIVGFAVVKAGKEKNEVKHLTKKEAKAIAKQIALDDIEENRLVEPDDSDEIEDDDDEDDELLMKLEMPKLKDIKCGSSGVVRLRWENVAKAQGYYIMVKSANRWRKLAEVPQGKSEYIDLYTSSNTSYTYTVKAFRNTGITEIESPKDEIGLMVYVEKGTLPAKIELSTVVSEDNKTYISWNRVPSIKLYQILRKKENDKWEIIKNVKKNDDRLFRDTDVASGIYAVRAVSRINETLIRGKFDKKGLEVNW